MLDLAADVDIVVENFRPGTLERWGLGYESLQEVNEDVILVRISGYGQDGPKSERPGFGTVAEGVSTFAHMNGFPDSEPLLPPLPLADYMAGLFAAKSAMFAIYERDVYGSDKGQEIDVSLYEPLFRLCVPNVEAYDQHGRVTDRTGNVSTNAAPRNLYETADGYISLSASSQRIFENVMEAIDRPDLISDPRFETNADRVEHREELDAIIEEWTQQRSREEALDELQAADAIAGPIYDIADVFEDDQFAAREDLVEVDDDDLGTVTTHGAVPKFSRTPGRVETLGTEKGAANDEIFLEELGLSEREYERLSSEDVI